MARTQAADYDDRREAILERAAELFAERGFNGASVADIAAACGMSKSLLYHYYPSKDDLLYSAMVSHLDALTEALGRERAVAGMPRDTLSAIVDAFMAIYVGAPARQKVLLNELDRLNDERRATVVGKQRKIVTVIESLLVAIEPALGKDPARLRAAAMLFFGMINWTHTWYRPQGSLAPDALAAMVAQMTLAGLPGLAVQPS